MVHLFRSETETPRSIFDKLLHCLNCPHREFGKGVKQKTRVIPIGWPSRLEKCRSIFLRYSDWFLTGLFHLRLFCKMESTQWLLKDNSPPLIYMMNTRDYIRFDINSRLCPSIKYFPDKRAVALCRTAPLSLRDELEQLSAFTACTLQRCTISYFLFCFCGYFNREGLG